MRLRVWGIAFVVALASLLSCSPAANAASGIWQSSKSEWTGKGAAFFPGGNYVGPAPGEVSQDCLGCSWTIHYLCIDNPNGLACIHSGCPESLEPIAIEYSTGRLGFQPVKCISPGGKPVSVGELSDRIGERLKQLAPKAEPGFQPKATAVTQIPTIFWAGQDNRIQRSDNISGVPVDFDATASWTWNWGDGTKVLHTTKVGNPWPDPDVKHTYRNAGKFHVTLATTWDASFSVLGVGPFPVLGEPVTQTVSFTVTVKEARAVLINNPVV